MWKTDENGWVVEALAPLAIEASWSLVGAEASGRMDIAGWQHGARTFFSTHLEAFPAKRYPTGASPVADGIELEVRPLGTSAPPTRVVVVTLPLDRAALVREAASAGARAIGGAGMDVLVARGRRSWQVRNAVIGGNDAAAPLLVAAILAASLLAPIVPPGGGDIFGVKGARARLEKLRAENA